MGAAFTLSKEDIEHIKSQGERLYGSVKISLPGYEVVYQTKHQSATKGYVMTYINSHFQYWWTSDKRPCPEQQFLRRREVALYKPKEKASLEKSLGKRQALKYFPSLQKTVVHFDCCWPSWSAVTAHIKKLARIYPGLKVVREA